jgi:hypothetical protein
MRERLTLLVAVVVVTAAACGGTATPEQAAELGSGYTSEVIDSSYEGALSVASQLALGTMLLEETECQVDPEQAEDLLPLWQAMQSGLTAEAEAEAVLRQIEATMTHDQLEAIGAMQLTQEDMEAWMADEGYAFVGSGPDRTLSPEVQATLEARRGGAWPPGGGQFQSPQDGEMPSDMATRMAQMQSMTDEEREAMRATAQAGGALLVGPGGAGGLGGFGGRGGGRTIGFLVRPLIELLEGRAAQG